MFRANRITVLLFLTVCLLSATFAGTTPTTVQASGGLSLKLSTEATTVHAMEQPKVSIVIHNGGRKPVVLVRPGDGSDRNLRTPLVNWLVEPVPGEGDPTGIIRVVMPDGNINALRPDEVFTLAPGESETFRTYVWTTFSKPGKYRVQYEYENRPSMEWGGIVLGEHDGGAMQRIRASTACKLTSNEVVFTVVE